MKPLFFRFVFFSVFALFDLSFIQVVFSEWILPPPFFLFSIVSLSLFRGFFQSRWWALGMGMVFDAIAFSHFGISSIECVFASACFGFATKRIFFGREWGKLFAFGIGAWMFALLFRGIVSPIFLTGAERSIGLASFFSMESFLTGVASLGVSLAIFPSVFFVVVSFERYLELFEQTSVGRR